jgi:alpha-amylase
LYLPVLRNAVKRELIDADRALDGETGIPAPVLDDLNADGFQEAELRSHEAVVVITAAGGQVSEVSDKRTLFDLLSTLTRRVEHYHLDTGEGDSGGEQEVATIHEAMKSMDADTRRKLVFDRYARYSFIDHFMPVKTDLSAYSDGSFRQLGDFAKGVYMLSLENGQIRAGREGWVDAGSGDRVPLNVEKVFSLEGSTLSVRYELTAGSTSLRGVLFVCEINLHFPSGTVCEADLDGNRFPLAEPAFQGRGSRLKVSDPVLGNPVVVSMSSPAEIRAYPVYTVSQSEEGFDVTYQGSCLSPGWILDFSSIEKVSLELTLAF